VAAPSEYPLVPHDPAVDDTAPVEEVTLRMQWLLVSATRRSPAASTARPAGPLKRALAPSAASRNPLLPHKPASVATCPAGAGFTVSANALRAPAPAALPTMPPPPPDAAGGGGARVVPPHARRTAAEGGGASVEGAHLYHAVAVKDELAPTGRCASSAEPTVGVAVKYEPAASTSAPLGTPAWSAVKDTPPLPPGSTA